MQQKIFQWFSTGDETLVYYFEPKCKCSNRVWVTKNAIHPSIANRQHTVKKVLYIIFFDNKGTVMQLLFPKARTIIGAFYKNIVLKKLKAHFKRRHSKTVLKYLPFLHDNALAHKACIVPFSSPKRWMFSEKRILPNAVVRYWIWIGKQPCLKEWLP